MHDGSPPNLTAVAIAAPLNTHNRRSHFGTITMSSRSLGELLLRPSPIIRTPLCQIRRTPASWTSRSISSTPSQPAAQPQRNDDGYDSTQQEQPSQQPRQAFRIRKTAPGGQQETSSRIDALFGGMPKRTPSTTYARPPQSTSSDEVRAARNNHIFGAGFSDPSSPNRRARGHGPPKLNFDDMSLPTDLLNPNLSNKPSEAANLATQQQETFANYPRLNPTYGRQVELDVSRGRDLVRGIGMLGSLMQRNRIRYEMNKQRFHERGGLKRKRLNSERWRNRFKKGFTEVTRRVSELTGKGW
jgi:small subunit ribosomal protein MRP21